MKIPSFLVAAMLSLLTHTTANATVIFDLTTAPSGPTASYFAGGINAVFSNPTLDGVASSFVIDGDGIEIVDGPTGFGAGLDRLEVVFDQTVRLLSYLPGFVEYGTEIVDFSSGAFSSIETGFVDETLTLFSNQFVVNAGETLVIAVTSPLPLVTNELVQIRELTVERVEVPVPATLALFGISLVGLGWSPRKSA